MVVFACNACGESLKKNQVENHYLRKCRNCNCLSCLDCGKDFWGNDYEQHTKCISEEEKYSGKNFVPKPGSNKNEIKQQQWLQQVQEAVEKCRGNPRLKAVLVRLKDQPNVPRKKNKFLNFLSNGFHVNDPTLGNQVWDMLMENTEMKKQENVQSETNSNNNNNSNNSKDSTDSIADSDNKTSNNCVKTDNITEVDSKKLSKREKKEERRKKLHKSEKKDKNNGETDPNVQNNGVITEKVSKKKSKKRKREDDEEVEEEDEVKDGDENEENDDDSGEEEPAKKKFKTKFNWNEIIVEVLQSKGPEMKTKKLRKKVLAEYLSQGCTERSEEKLWSRFDKKLKKIPEVKVIGEKVKLKNTS